MSHFLKYAVASGGVVSRFYYRYLCKHLGSLGKALSKPDPVFVQQFRRVV
jgi:hypothetical protein